MSEQDKKRRIIYDLPNTETKQKISKIIGISLSIVLKANKNVVFLFLQKKDVLRKSGSGRLNKNRKECFLIALTTMIKKDPRTSIRKLINELKVD